MLKLLRGVQCVAESAECPGAHWGRGWSKGASSRDEQEEAVWNCGELRADASSQPCEEVDKGVLRGQRALGVIPWKQIYLAQPRGSTEKKVAEFWERQ